jgi:hypothetical protein
MPCFRATRGGFLESLRAGLPVEELCRTTPTLLPSSTLRDTSFSTRQQPQPRAFMTATVPCTQSSTLWRLGATSPWNFGLSIAHEGFPCRILRHAHLDHAVVGVETAAPQPIDYGGLRPSERPRRPRGDVPRLREGRDGRLRAFDLRLGMMHSDKLFDLFHALFGHVDQHQQMPFLNRLLELFQP